MSAKLSTCSLVCVYRGAVWDLMWPVAISVAVCTTQIRTKTVLQTPVRTDLEDGYDTPYLLPLGRKLPGIPHSLLVQ